MHVQQVQAMNKRVKKDGVDRAVVVGDDEKVIKALTLSSLSSRVRERASKEFLKTVGVAGDEVHPLRVAFVELKKGVDSAASNKAIVVGDMCGLANVVLGLEGWLRC